jgi:hypothetical protein
LAALQGLVFVFQYDIAKIDADAHLNAAVFVSFPFLFAFRVEHCRTLTASTALPRRGSPPHANPTFRLPAAKR